MKCTQCGCKRFIESKFSNLISVGGWDVQCSISETVKIFACLECGHLEFFDKMMPDKLAQAETKLKQLNDELDSLLHDKESKDSLINELTEEITRIEERLKNLDITVREQNELSEKSQQINNEIQQILQARRSIDKRIQEIAKNKEATDLEVQKLRKLCVGE